MVRRAAAAARAPAHAARRAGAARLAYTLARAEEQGQSQDLFWGFDDRYPTVGDRPRRRAPGDQTHTVVANAIARAAVRRALDARSCTLGSGITVNATDASAGLGVGRERTYIFSPPGRAVPRTRPRVQHAERRPAPGEGLHAAGRPDRRSAGRPVQRVQQRELRLLRRRDDRPAPSGARQRELRQAGLRGARPSAAGRAALRPARPVERTVSRVREAACNVRCTSAVERRCGTASAPASRSVVPAPVAPLSTPARRLRRHSPGRGARRAGSPPCRPGSRTADAPSSTRSAPHLRLLLGADATRARADPRPLADAVVLEHRGGRLRARPPTRSGVERGWITRAQAARAHARRRCASSGARRRARQRHRHRRPQGVLLPLPRHGDRPRFQRVELSTIDTALLLAGVLFCREYFDRRRPGRRGDPRARRLALPPRRLGAGSHAGRAAGEHGWHPEPGLAQHDANGFILRRATTSRCSSTCSRSARRRTRSTPTALGGVDEHLRVATLPRAGVRARSRRSSGTSTRTSGSTSAGSSDAYMRGRGIDYFENSRRATLVAARVRDRQPATAAATTRPTSGDSRPATARSTRRSPSTGGTRTVPHVLGARRRARTRCDDDGTIAPTAAAGSIAFAPDVVDAGRSSDAREATATSSSSATAFSTPSTRPCARPVRRCGTAESTPDARVVRQRLPGHRPGTDRADDRELSERS